MLCKGANNRNHFFEHLSQPVTRLYTCHYHMRLTKMSN